MRASRSTQDSSSTSATIEGAQPSARSRSINGFEGDGEWFQEPDDVERVESALRSIGDHLDTAEAVTLVAFRVAGTQGFAEGNKRTALLLARWTLDNNELAGYRIIEPDDRELTDLLVHTAFGRDVEADILQFFAERA